MVWALLFEHVVLEFLGFPEVSYKEWNPRFVVVLIHESTFFGEVSVWSCVF